MYTCMFRHDIIWNDFLWEIEVTCTTTINIHVYRTSSFHKRSENLFVQDMQCSKDNNAGPTKESSVCRCLCIWWLERKGTSPFHDKQKPHAHTRRWLIGRFLAPPPNYSVENYAAGVLNVTYPVSTNTRHPWGGGF